MNDKLFEVYKKIDDVLLIFEDIINQSMTDFQGYDIDRILINTYTRFRALYKILKGNAAGITGISEIIYVKFIQLFFEAELSKYYKKQITFDLETSKNIQIFRIKGLDGVELIFTCGINVNDHLDLILSYDEPKMAPDGFIAIKKDNQLIPVAIIEIKLQIGPKKFSEDILNRFQGIKSTLEQQNFKELPFLVCIFLGSQPSGPTMSGDPTMDELITEFLSLSPEKCRIMRKIRAQRHFDYEKFIYTGKFDSRGSPTINILSEILSKIVKLIS